MNRNRTRRTFKTKEEMIRDAKSALLEIQAGTSENDTYATLLFAERYPLDSIIPRVTLLTFNAWKAFGRHVRKGEKGTAVTVWTPLTRRSESGAREVVTRHNEKTGSDTPVMIATTSHLFHIAQTEPDEVPHRDCWTLSAAQRSALAACATRPTCEESELYAATA